MFKADMSLYGFRFTYVYLYYNQDSYWRYQEESLTPAFYLRERMVVRVLGFLGLLGLRRVGGFLRC